MQILSQRAHSVLQGRVLVAALLISLGPSLLAAQRPIILLVHGRAQSANQRKTIEQAWFTSFESGLRAAGMRNLIGPSDVRFVWYADAYQGLLCRTSVGDFDISDRVRRALVNLLEQLPLAQKVVGNEFISDTHIYFAELCVREAIDHRLRSAINDAQRAGRPVVIAAHSMGSLVSFDVLAHTEPAAAPVRIITFGSMLSLRPVMQALFGSETSEVVNVPLPILQWTNFTDSQDPFAFRMAEYFKAKSPSRLPVDVRTRGKAVFGHPAENYLTNPAVAKAIAAFWCASYRSQPPPSCPSPGSIRSDAH